MYLVEKTYYKVIGFLIINDKYTPFSITITDLSDTMAILKAIIQEYKKSEEMRHKCGELEVRLMSEFNKDLFHGI